MNPTFDTLDLTDYASAEVLGSPASRTFRERLPDVEGEFFQVNPRGGREIAVRGFLGSSVWATASLAGADLKARLRARQDRVGSVATYRGTDAQAYANALLLEYRQLGPIQVSPLGAGLQALTRIEARIVTQP